MTPALPLSCDIVLIGGGHAHALLLRQWGMDPLPGARLTVINPAPTAPYTGMLPGFVAGHYARDELEIDLVRLARFAGARIVLGVVDGIDRAARTIHIEGRGSIGYDYASFDIGITSYMPEVPGFAEHGIAAKPLGLYARRWRAHLAAGGGPVVVIGAGLSGVELALAMRHAQGANHAVTVVERGTALRGVGRGTAARLRQAMADAGITLIEQAEVTAVGARDVTLATGERLPAALTVGAAGARPFDWLRETGLDLTEGYIAVKATLTSTNDKRLFAVGDCAHLTASPRPKAGVFAVRAAPVLTANLRAVASGRGLVPFKPQSHYLKLVSLGRKAALADKWGRSIGGDWAWRWKDRIDRAFMDRLNNPPPMPRPKLPVPRAKGAAEALGSKPLCGGCGSKVGAGVLDRVLAGLPKAGRADVITRAGDDAAVLRVGAAQQVLTVDHLRAFWEDPWLFARITALHALGDVWAMGAAPQAVLAQITLPRMSEALQARWLGEVMEAAGEVFRAEGAEIVGGHTNQGAEFSLGFTVTGLGGARTIGLEGAAAGDVLLLTRPIGSGTLLAAEMQGKVRGDDLAAALEVMATSQGDAARALAGVATAMTDVTGFGLAGHAARMGAASGLAVRLEREAVPVFAGAQEAAEAGVRSTIWEANRAAVAYVGEAMPLLFDPQTAGGLLAALPVAEAEGLLAKVRALGHEAAVIGTLIDGAPGEVRLAG